MKSIEMKKILQEWRRYRVELLSERNNPFGYKSQHPYEFIPVADELGEALYNVDSSLFNNKALILSVVNRLELKNFDLEGFISSISVKKISSLNDLANSDRKLNVNTAANVLIFEKNKEYTQVMLNLIQEFDENIVFDKDYDDNNMTQKYLDNINWSDNTPVVITTNIGNFLEISVQKNDFESMMWTIHDLLHRFEDYTYKPEVKALFSDFKEKTGLESFHQNRGEETIIGRFGSQIKNETGYYFDLETALGATNWIQSLTSGVGRDDVYPTLIGGLCLIDLNEIDSLDLKIDTSSKIFREQYSGWIDESFIEENEDFLNKILKSLLKELYPVCLRYLNDIVPKAFLGKCIIVPTQSLEES